jgi:hypothetical protein
VETTDRSVPRWRLLQTTCCYGTNRLENTLNLHRSWSHERSRKQGINPQHTASHPLAGPEEMNRNRAGWRSRCSEGSGSRSRTILRERAVAPPTDLGNGKPLKCTAPSIVSKHSAYSSERMSLGPAVRFSARSSWTREAASACCARRWGFGAARTRSSAQFRSLVRPLLYLKPRPGTISDGIPLRNRKFTTLRSSSVCRLSSEPLCLCAVRAPGGWHETCYLKPHWAIQLEAPVSSGGGVVTSPSLHFSPAAAQERRHPIERLDD